ncbi:serine/threonine-protein kinase [Chondromyces apiculatus]|uniref:Serine/threonine protein kinase n=1 Tax=Chondromyces apiculatus DSM 436 TaxID=1192034 RepID=A0A017TJP0_9BACT|nr:serine/threonine-protein kinase [Chondromyces apiculatus]EYF08871.1 serine/threonine protein kinase [Chondromyces apiculatus DSM 436]
MNEPISVGDLIAGVYRVEGVIGRGGMGVVYEATHVPTGIARAVKVMLPEAARHPRAVKSFISESWSACTLQSEYVVRVLDVGEHHALPFMAMELLEGRDLGAVLAERKVLPARDSAQYVLQICEALTEAHALGVVHRDIKPENVFLARRPDGTTGVKVLDFGLAKVEAVAFPAGSATPRASLIGSPCFMSPEQIRGEEIDGRSDLWSVGVLLYRMLTSQLPFRPAGRVGIASLLTSILKSEPIPPSQLMPSIPTALAAIVMRCLEKNRDRRFGSAAELALALVSFASPDAVQTLTRPRRTVRPSASTIPPRLSIAPLGASRHSIAPLGAALSSIPPAGLPRHSVPPVGASRHSFFPPGLPRHSLVPPGATHSTSPPAHAPRFSSVPAGCSCYSTVPPPFSLPPPVPRFNPTLWDSVPPSSSSAARQGGVRHARALVASASLLAAASSLGAEIPEPVVAPSPAAAEPGVAAKVKALLAALRAPDRPPER